MREFIKQALYDRYDDFVGSNEILDEFIEEFAELVAEGGVSEGATAWTIIDNRYINGEHGFGGDKGGTAGRDGGGYGK